MSAQSNKEINSNNDLVKTITVQYFVWIKPSEASDSVQHEHVDERKVIILLSYEENRGSIDTVYFNYKNFYQSRNIINFLDLKFSSTFTLI